VYKSILIALVCLITAYKTSGQNRYFMDEYHKFFGGLIAGGNFATIDNDDFTHYYHVGLNVGGIVYMRLGQRTALSLEILYSQKGNTSSNDLILPSGITGVNITRDDVTLNYAEIPVMFHIFDKQHINHISAGLTYSRLVGSSEIFQLDQPYYVDMSKYSFNKSDLQYAVGAQVRVSGGLFLSVRFQFSLLQIRDNVPTGFAPPEQINNLFAIRGMYLF